MGKRPLPTVEYLDRVGSHKDVGRVVNDEFAKTLAGDTARIRRAMDGSTKSLGATFSYNRGVRFGYFVTNALKRTIEGPNPASIAELFLYYLHLSKLTASSIDILKSVAFASKTMAFDGFTPQEVEKAKSVLEDLVPFDAE